MRARRERTGGRARECEELAARARAAYLEQHAAERPRVDEPRVVQLAARAEHLGRDEAGRARELAHVPVALDALGLQDLGEDLARRGARRGAVGRGRGRAAACSRFRLLDADAAVRRAEALVLAARVLLRVPVAATRGLGAAGRRRLAARAPGRRGRGFTGSRAAARRRRERRRDGAQPKVAQVDEQPRRGRVDLAAHEDVLGLDVAVDDAVLEAVVERTQHAARDGVRERRVEHRALVHKLVQVGAALLHHEVHVLGRVEHVDEPAYIAARRRRGARDETRDRRGQKRKRARERGRRRRARPTCGAARASP